MKSEQKQRLLQNRRWRIRKSVFGTAQKPRLSIKFTNKHIYAQCIDDESGRTLVSVSSLSKEVKDQNAAHANVKGSMLVGTAFAKKALAVGISKVVLDRNGRKYHTSREYKQRESYKPGCICTFSEAARSEGLIF